MSRDAGVVYFDYVKYDFAAGDISGTGVDCRFHLVNLSSRNLPLFVRLK